MVSWINQPCAVLDLSAQQQATLRQTQLTKPPGSLGRLEEIAIQMAAWQGTALPQLSRIHISIFAADHGVAAEGVSLFPQAVTGEMVRNFARGGAAISVLSQQLGGNLEVINLGTVEPVEALDNVIDQRIAPGTANFCLQAAMTAEQCMHALQAGSEAVQRAKNNGAQLFIGGEMGIANTTSASAIACALLQLPPSLMAGPGTGLNAQGVLHKTRVLERALAFHHLDDSRPLSILQCVGGFEIAGLVGAYLAAAQQGLPMLIDGFISSVAALLAVSIQPQARDWMLFAHSSAEPGHQHVLQALAATPLLQLGMRLGEGSGAAMAVPLIQLACQLHGNMATFAQASVSERI